MGLTVAGGAGLKGAGADLDAGAGVAETFGAPEIALFIWSTRTRIAALFLTAVPICWSFFSAACF